jgi:tetratricopeptide (TPR) repeat protein
MDRQNLEENLIDYLCGSLSSSEEQAYHSALEGFPDLQEEIASLQKVRQVVRRSLPSEPVPSYLIKQIKEKIKPEKKTGWGFISLWRPALMGAGIAALLVVFVNLYQQREFSSPLNTPAESIALAPSPNQTNSNFGMRQPDFPSSLARPYLGQGSRYGMGLVSNASLGGGFDADSFDDSFDNSDDQDLGQLEQNARSAIAQLYYQQAVRLHKMGDHRAAANMIGKLLQSYPNFPYFFEALALRINCLFQDKDYQQASQELFWLKKRSPDLAQLLEERWKR